ncbi:Histone-lysine N-methyltransferase SUVR5 [Hordeum vulgare]|nr:Histone-lysine N-methyltransferase SUVR5 [Hordeum vulgare]
MPDYPDTQEADTINIDTPEKDGYHVIMVYRKRKWIGFMEEELSVFNNMIQAVKEVSIAIRGSKAVDVHPEIYDVIMEQGDFIPKALMVALRHLLDNKAEGVGFVSMGEPRMVI